MIKATVICDASFCNTVYVGGWATWVRVDGHGSPLKYFGTFAKQPRNSTEAEVFAAINGIYVAKIHGAEAVLVQSDCSAVIDLIEGRTKSENLIATWQGALEKNALGHIVLTGAHVKGHTNDPAARSWCNRWCDEKAGEQMRRARGQKVRNRHRG